MPNGWKGDTPNAGGPMTDNPMRGPYLWLALLILVTLAVWAVKHWLF